MAKKQKDKNPDSNHDKSIAGKEYEYAISLMKYATELLWHQFGVFMLTETIIIGYLGNALTKNNQLVFAENSFVFVGSLFGLLISFLWYSTYEYNHSFYLLRMEQAKQHEEVLEFSLLKEGKKQSDENIIPRWLQPYRALKYLIGLFSILFIILIFYSRPWQ